MNRIILTLFFTLSILVCGCRKTNNINPKDGLFFNENMNSVERLQTEYSNNLDSLILASSILSKKAKLSANSDRNKCRIYDLYVKLASNFIELGNTTRAEICILKVLFDEHFYDEEIKVRAYYNLGRLNLSVFKFDEAVIALDKAQDLCIKGEIKNRQKYLEDCIELKFLVYLENMEFEKAWEQLRCFENLIRLNMTNQCRYHFLKGKYFHFQFIDEAEESFNTAIQCLVDIHNSDSLFLSRILDELVEIFTESKQFDKALEISDQSLILKEFNLKKNIEMYNVELSRALFDRIELHIEIGQHTQNISHYHKAIRLINQIKKNCRINEIDYDHDNVINQNEILFELSELEIKVYYKLWTTFGSTDYRDKLCNLVEYWKNPKISDYKNFDSQNLLRKIEEVKARIENNQSVELLEKLELIINEFYLKEKSNFKIDYSQKANIVNVQELLNICERKNAVILDYFIGHSAFTIRITYSKCGVIIEEINPDNYWKDALALTDSLKLIDQFEFFPVAKRLYLNLIPPIDEDTKHVIINPSSILQRLPFESLVYNTKSKINNVEFIDFLGGKFYCSLKYSTSKINDQYFNYDKYRDSNELRYAGYAYSDWSTYKSKRQKGLNELPGTIEEVKNLAKLYQKGIGTIRFGLKATKRHFVKTIIDYDILHLALHSEYNIRSRLKNKIVFRGSAYERDLFSYDLLKTDVNSDLVVLSLCHGNSGKLFNNLGVYSMSKAFINNGATHVISNLYSQGDSVGSHIFQSFYRQLSKTGNVFSSLRSAKRNFFYDNFNGNKHPYYWAGISLH